MSALSRTVGAAASMAWLEQRGLDASRVAHWYIEITLETEPRGVRLDLNIYPEEWGFVVRREGQVSSIRVTDIAFVHGHDDHQLLAHAPGLDRIGDLITKLETRFDVRFLRTHAKVKTNLIRASAVVRPWLVGLR